MHALMGKSNKAPTPQELYKARKQKEEAERTAFLPPGLVNHGNTCFMNSVLQGLIATPMLADVMRFALPESYAPILSRRSPQLTNGHGFGGAAEREWEQGMPLGDTFVFLMQKAWKDQDERLRESMSPRDLLQRIGAKYDQYLDFRQQDAHEFLRHLLDAMRMEELDIIKKRQPPRPKAKRRRRSTNGNTGLSSTTSPASPDPSSIPEEDRLVSFVDMVFGGRLASILVCEKCKKISCTYEDFNDLSLSIKQEDYEKARKRDRLRTLARKLGMRGRVATRELDIPDAPRSSSVPSSPLRRSEEAERSFELSLNDVGHRRRSLEAEEMPALREEIRLENPPAAGEALAEQQNPREERRTLGILEENRPLEDEDLRKEEIRREKDEDGWVKLRRKISVGMGVNVKKSKKKGGGLKEALPGIPSNEDSQAETTGDEALESFVDVKAPSPLPVSPATSPLLGASIALQKFSFVRRPSSSRTEINSPALSTLPSPSRTPEIPSVSLPPSEVRPTSPVPPTAPPDTVRPKSPRPPKPTRSESVYLRRLLADVPVNTSTPFNLFRTGPLASSSPDISDIRGAWPKLGHVQTVEGCLRMFTAVEVLDGENMVACRRCWKIQHGLYNPREKEVDKAEEEDEDEDEGDADADEDDSASSSSTSASMKISPVEGDKPPTNSTGLKPSPLDLTTFHSAPASVTDIQDSDEVPGIPFPSGRTRSSPTLSVPSISMTAPEMTTPSASEQTLIVDAASESVARRRAQMRLISSPSQDSLQVHLPSSRHSREPAERQTSVSVSVNSDTSSASSDESSNEADGTETSLTASMRSDSSSVASTQLDPSISKAVTSATLFVGMQTSEPLLLRSPGSTKSNTSKRGISPSRSKSGASITVPRSKQVTMRRAYKRYLIASPPPVLVVHLKRFQQVGSGRTPSAQLQFFTNFKKLDDPVSFGEYLDLSPFLLPSREEGRGKGKGGKMRGKGKRSEGKEGDARDAKAGAGAEGCMYRLYAVVVHIGNMLGGHYVAYTALPEAASPPGSAGGFKEKDDSSSLSLSLSSSSYTEATRPEMMSRTTSFQRTAKPHTTSTSGSGSGSGSKSRTSTSSTTAAGQQRQRQRQWCYVSDTIVRLASLEEVLQAKAYICMYERI